MKNNFYVRVDLDVEIVPQSPDVGVAGAIATATGISFLQHELKKVALLAMRQYLADAGCDVPIVGKSEIEDLLPLQRELNHNLLRFPYYPR